MIAALFVQTGGCYYGIADVDPWDLERDARHYAGPHPVVAHPPCQRWGRFWHGSTRKPHQFKLGDDGGCFAAGLAAVRKYGGVLEHPADSRAWSYFGLSVPPRAGGWIAADFLVRKVTTAMRPVSELGYMPIRLICQNCGGAIASNVCIRLPSQNTATRRRGASEWWQWSAARIKPKSAMPRHQSFAIFF